MPYKARDAIRQDKEVGIQMPETKLSKYTTAIYYTFQAKLDTAVYCASTELSDSNRFGYMYMAGTPREPALVPDIIQSGHTISNREQIAAMYSVIHTTCSQTESVCDPDGPATMQSCHCPTGAFPDGQYPIPVWVNQTILRHISRGIYASSSDELLLRILLEVTKIPDGHLCKMLAGPPP